ALAVTSTSAPSKPQAQTQAGPAAANPILARLASNITPLQDKLPGDATLHIRNQSPTSTELGTNGIGLYTDDGIYYWANDKNALRRIVAQKTGGDDSFRRNIEVALYAVKGDIGTARARMAVANLTPGMKQNPERDRIEKLKGLAEAKGEEYVPPKPRTPTEQKEITDNHIWMNSLNALIAAPENTQVRAGVLRIMATMPNVSVKRTTTAGQPTLTLTNIWPTVADRHGETLVIDAGTGRPVALISRVEGKAVRTTYHHTFRVTLADIAAGKF
ncbi:hypothetical protein ACFQ07_01320, partial [Actinomadura adrarensis]